MKTKKFKRVLTLVLALAMMLSLSMVSFATDTVDLYVNGVYQGACNINYSYTHNGVNIVANTVYDILYVKYGTAAVWSSESNAIAAYSPFYEGTALTNPLYGKYNYKVNYLSSLNGTESAPHTPAAGALDVDGNYIPTQTVDNALKKADTALAAYGGLGYWQGGGYGYSVDETHMVYVGDDWAFYVNGIKPGKDLIPESPIYGDRFQYTMRESLLSNGVRVDLIYEDYNFIFELP